MRLPLLVSASPSVQKTPVVHLREGTWITEGNLKDTEVSIMFILNEDGHSATVGLGEEIELSSKSKAKVVITRKGTERAISIDAVRIRD